MHMWVYQLALELGGKQMVEQRWRTQPVQVEETVRTSPRRPRRTVQEDVGKTYLSLLDTSLMTLTTAL
jgi:hypothetical protein